MLDIIKNIRNLFTKQKTRRLSVEPDSVYLPRTNDPKSKIINPRFPKQALIEIEKIALTNPVLSQVHNLVINLANTGHTVETETEEMKQEITQLATKINTDSLVNGLLSQIILYGCISAEVVVSEKLDGIEKIVRVHPATVSFVYDEENDSYTAYQTVADKTIQLNPNTYIYIPLLTIDGSPYGIPPMLAALGLAETTETFISELKSLATKMGLLGFMDITFPPLPKSPSETEFEYQERARRFLQNTADEISSNISKGLLLHFEGTQVEFKEISNNTAGIKDIINSIEKWLIEGAKGQPALLGFSEGLTETWATVSLHIFVSQLKNYQRVVERFLEYVYKLHLTLKGYQFKDVNVSFIDPPNFKAKEEEEIRKTRAETVISLLQAGIINTEEARRLMEELL